MLDQVSSSSSEDLIELHALEQVAKTYSGVKAFKFSREELKKLILAMNI